MKEEEEEKKKEEEAKINPNDRLESKRPLNPTSSQGQMPPNMA